MVVNYVSVRLGIGLLQSTGETWFLGASVRGIQEEVSIWTRRLSKEDHPYAGWVGGGHPIRWEPDRKHGGRNGEFTLSVEQECSSSPAPDISALGSSAFRLWPGLTPSSLWFSGQWAPRGLYYYWFPLCLGFWTWTEWHYLSWFSSLQAVDRGTSQLP